MGVEVEVRPGDTPAGRPGEARPELAAHVGPRRRVLVRRNAAVRGVDLAPRVRHEEVRQAVVVVVGGGDAHARARVGDPGGGRALLEAKADARWIGLGPARPRNVLVQAVRVRVVREVEVEVAVAVDVRQHGAEAVLEARDLEPRFLAHLPERRPSVAGSAVAQEQEVTHAEVGVGEAQGRVLVRVLHGDVAGDEEIGPAVAVHVSD